jgi:hypothetical protein
MKWFKHITGSLKDPMIADAITEFGGDGYLVFFGLLDLMAEDFDIDDPGVKTFKVAYLTRNLQVSRQKFVKILSFFQNYSKGKTKESSKILAEFNGDNVTLKCLKLKELCDEWTGKQLRSNSGVNPEPLLPIEEEVDKDNREVQKKKKKHMAKSCDLPVSDDEVVPTTYSAPFEKFMTLYPRRVSKAAAYKAWQKIGIEKKASITTIMKALQAQLDAGMFDFSDDLVHIAHPSTWLNEERWLNEIVSKQPQQPKLPLLT